MLSGACKLAAMNNGKCMWEGLVVCSDRLLRVLHVATVYVYRSSVVISSFKCI